jgi:hypothetical protein
MTAGSKLVTATSRTIWQHTPTAKGIQLAVVSDDMVQRESAAQGAGRGGHPCVLTERCCYSPLIVCDRQGVQRHADPAVWTTNQYAREAEMFGLQIRPRLLCCLQDTMGALALKPGQ